MKKRMKRMLVLLMTAVLMISMLSVGALAEGEAEETSEEVISEEETEEETASEEDAEAETDAEEAETESEEVLEETSDTEEAADTAALGEDEESQGDSLSIMSVSEEETAASAEDGTGETITVTTNSGLTSAVNTISSSDSQTGTIVIGGDFTISTGITIPEGADITITDDGSARTITVSTGSAASITVAAGGKLTIDGSNLTIAQGKTSNTYSILLVEGEAELENGTITNKNYKLKAGSTSSNTYGGVVTVVGTSAVFKMSGGTIGNASATGNYTGLVVVRDGASFEMSGGTITGFSTTNNYTSAVLVYAYNGDAAFEMSGGTISKNETSHYGGGVQVYAYSSYTGSFTMTGGEISQNEAGEYGGGIYFNAYSDKATASVTISGGSIKDNIAVYGGGGIGCAAYYSYENVSLTINGGTIAGNKVEDNDSDADTCGGGIYTAGAAKMVISGGSFTDNSAGTYGGGMYLGGSSAEISNVTVSGNTAQTGGGIFAACDTYLYSGDIKDNTANGTSIKGEGHGGGIYVASGHTLYLYNVIVTENTASVLGGGLWACNTGSIELYVTDGGAIYSNDAQGDEGKTTSEAGDDIASVTKSSESYILFLAGRILGGGSANYYTDGGIDLTDSYSMGYADTSAARYSSDSEEITSYSATSESYALKDIVLAGAIALAESKAELVISGNSALRGGGIATNGSVVIGSAEGKTTSVTVTKTWDDSDDADGIRPDSVTVNLYNTVDGTAYLIDTATLSEADGWTCTFDELPVDEDCSYSVAEEVPTGYTAEYSDPAGSISEGYEITITNVHEPADEETGNDTDDTDDTDDTGDTDDSEDVEDVEASDTGDPGVMLWIVLLGVAAVCILIGKKKIAK